LKFKEAIEEATTKSKKRKFSQSIELVFNFSKIDFNKPDTRLKMDIVLPKGRGKARKAAVIAGDELVPEAKANADLVLTQDDIKALGKDKKRLKKVVDQNDFFICQADLMPLVGKEMGQVLGPKGKMPRPVPPNAKLKLLIESMKKTVNVASKGKFLPTIHAVIGTEEMTPDDLTVNAETIYNAIIEKMPNREGNIRSVFVKTSMGPSIKVTV